MSNNEQIQNSLVNLVESFEEMQSQLEEKHFGKVIETDSDLENVTEDQITNCTEEFLNSMQDVFEGIGEHNLVKLDTVVRNVNDAIEAIYDFGDDLEDELEDQVEGSDQDALDAVNGNPSN